MQIIDANVILRYILEDIPEQTNQAAKVIESGASTTYEVIAEVVYVMEGYYHMARNDVSWFIQMVLCDVEVPDKNVMRYALGIYNQTTLDFVDCLMIAYEKSFDASVFTFDKKLNNALKKEYQIYDIQKLVL